jgi:hypothetical protein
MHEHLSDIASHRCPVDSQRWQPGRITAPDECIDKIRAFQSMTHAQEFVFICQFGGMPMDRAEKSMRLFADRVLPVMHEIEVEAVVAR